MNQNDNQDFLLEIKHTALSVLDKGDSLFLYGSRARGTSTSTSDWDLLIITKDRHSEDNAFDKYVFPLVLFGQQKEQAISVMVYSPKEWEKRKSTPFYQNVMNDRIRVL